MRPTRVVELHRAVWHLHAPTRAAEAHVVVTFEAEGALLRRLVEEAHHILPAIDRPVVDHWLRAVGDADHLLALQRRVQPVVVHAAHTQVEMRVVNDEIRGLGAWVLSKLLLEKGARLVVLPVELTLVAVERGRLHRQPAARRQHCDSGLDWAKRLAKQSVVAGDVRKVGARPGGAGQVVRHGGGAGGA